MSLFMVLSTVTGMASPITVKDTPKVEQGVTESEVVKKTSNREVEKIMSTEQYVKEYFKDVPIMVLIAKCESHFRQLDQDGDVHRGVKNPADVGVMQINEHYHLDKSVKENYDIYTLTGNTAYARELYEKQGTEPWNSSRACWSKYLPKADSQLAVNAKT